jgi:hypothetical protein
MARESNSFSLLLRYQAQAERHYRRAIEEFDRLKALRAELPNEPITEPDLEPTKTTYPDSQSNPDGTFSDACNDSSHHTAATGKVPSSRPLPGRPLGRRPRHGAHCVARRLFHREDRRAPSVERPSRLPRRRSRRRSSRIAATNTGMAGGTPALRHA